MTFAIATGEPEPNKPKLYDGVLSYRDHGTRAERKHRQIIAAIEVCESIQEVEDILIEEDLVIDALLIDFPDYFEAIREAADDHKAILAHGGQNAEATAQTHSNAPLSKSTKENTMNAFSNFDTGGSGSEGPWLQWSARGTQDGAVPPKSFFIRDENTKTAFTGFAENGVILDIENMQTGWCYSSGAVGEAPTWKMNPDLSNFMPQPGDDYKKGFKMRVATGGGNTASWDQSGAGAWNAFVALVPELAKQPAPGKLPLVKMVDVKHEQYKRGSTQIPVLQIVNWVDRPDCLKEGVAAGVAVEPQQQTEQAVQAAAANAAPASSVPADAGF